MKHKNDSLNEYISIEEIQWNARQHELIIRDQKICLTKTQYRLIHPLRHGWPVTYNGLANIVYNYDADPHVRVMIDKHIDRIRDKIRGTGIYIYCVIGYGYLLLNHEPHTRYI